MDNALVREFPPRTLDKVERLLDLLTELDEHPMLKDKWALHGGTAINLFMLEVPRLSVDIDLSYIGALDRDAMIAERAVIERSIDEVARSQGYAVSGAPGGHAGRTFTFNYRSQWGSDHVKIDCIYLNRSPLMAIERRSSPLMPGLYVPLFADTELVGGKVKAFFDRVKVCDLYDIANLKLVLDARSVEERSAAHRVILFYSSLSATFPHGFESRSERFAGRERELEEQLLPMLRKNEEAPILEQLIGTAHEFVSTYVLPQTDAGEEYLGCFARGVFKPTLLFENEATARAAIASPEAQWKLQNIRKMLRAE